MDFLAGSLPGKAVARPVKIQVNSLPNLSNHNDLYSIRGATAPINNPAGTSRMAPVLVCRPPARASILLFAQLKPKQNFLAS